LRQFDHVPGYRTATKQRQAQRDRLAGGDLCQQCLRQLEGGLHTLPRNSEQGMPGRHKLAGLGIEPHDLAGKRGVQGCLGKSPTCRIGGGLRVGDGGGERILMCLRLLQCLPRTQLFAEQLTNALNIALRLCSLQAQLMQTGLSRLQCRLCLGVAQLCQQCPCIDMIPQFDRPQR
jgi:hypothetical protein